MTRQTICLGSSAFAFCYFASSMHSDLPRPEKSGSSSREKSSSGKLRLLLVEDHADTRRSMEVLLRRSGYHVRPAATAQEAIELAANEKFDLVITDIGLPDLSGGTLMKQLSDNYGLKGIATTGYMAEAGRSDDSSIFLHRLTKPINLEFLRQVLSEFDKKRRGNG